MTVAIFLGSLLIAMAIGIPIAYSLLLSGIALMWHLDLFDAQILAQNVINGADSFPLLAVPFFMLAGEIMNVGGLSKRIVKLALAVVGHVPGGLGYVAIMAAVILAAVSGSAVADAAALASLLAAGSELQPAVSEALGFLDQSLDAGFRPGMGNIVPDRFFWALPPPEEGEEGGGVGSDDPMGGNGSGGSDGKGVPRRVH